MARNFQAVTCVEIRNVRKFCQRIRSSLPPAAAFRARPVEYYSEAQGGSPRWALPDAIATSKLSQWAGQDEYRFLFSPTDALGFENVALRLVSRKQRPVSRPDEHIDLPLSIGPLLDICAVHDCTIL